LWQAYLASLVLFEEACGARRHWPGGKEVACNIDRPSDLVSISQKAKSRLVWDEMVMADIA
jgi:hypothetical protein